MGSVSEPVLDGLLDQLLEKRVFTDKEMKSVRAERGRAGKAWRVLLMVRGKGDEASSVMMDILRQLDPVLSEKLQQGERLFLEYQFLINVITERYISPVGLVQGCQTHDPRAFCGPQRGPMWSAT